MEIGLKRFQRGNDLKFNEWNSGIYLSLKIIKGLSFPWKLIMGLSFPYFHTGGNLHPPFIIINVFMIT